MSRYDYRIKKQVFRKTNYQKYQDFRRLQSKYSARKRWNWLWTVLILLFVIGLSVLLIPVAKANENSTQKHNAPVQEVDWRIPEHKL